MQKAVIVVPLYKIEHDAFDIVALKQLEEVLGKYPIVFVVPEGYKVDVEAQCGLKAKYSREYFDRTFFISKESYSRLCLHKSFYERFIDYEYMLIYQTDAFVFEDRLGEFISLDYDYIGAPQDNEGFNCFHVGNGGFSLRRIQSAIKILSDKESILDALQAEIAHHYLEYEDNFWGYCGHNPRIDFSVPPIEIAGKFSLQGDCLNIYDNMLDTGVPFGLHGWPYCDYSFWKPIIEKFGYKLPDENQVNPGNMYKEVYAMNNRTWYENIQEQEVLLLLEEMRLSPQGHYIIWGNGKYGKKTVALFKKLGVRIDLIFDQAATKGQSYEGIGVCYPSETLIREMEAVIVVAIKGAYNEISTYIHSVAMDRLVMDVQTLIDAFDSVFRRCNPRSDVYAIQEKLLKS